MLTDLDFFQMQTSGLITMINLAPNHIRPVFYLNLISPTQPIAAACFVIRLFFFQNTTNLSIIRDNANHD